IQIARGELTVRTQLHGKPAHAASRAFLDIPDTLAKRAADKQPTGMWRLRVPIATLAPAELTGALAQMTAQMGVDAKADILDNLTGELVLYTTTGSSTRLVIELGAEDGQRLQPLVPALCTMSSAA